MCSPVLEEGGRGGRKSEESKNGRIASQRTFEARVSHVGHKKELAVDIDALVRHEHFGANRRVQEKDDDDRELNCLRDGGIEREAAAMKLARNASCIAREPLENNARNGEDDEDKSENADNDERLRGGVKMMKTLARRWESQKNTYGRVNERRGDTHRCHERGE
jgi:hypothetical protein